jgi:hypothetical protein
MGFNSQKLKIAVLMGNAVTTKAILVVAGWWFGRKLDAHYGTAPWLMTLGICLGVGFGLWFVLLVAKKNNLT